ncbi:S-adenosyl-L-methionine-dependent methyltransferase [Rhizophagus irregularis]|uniref:S-adenosyl-L-methionine-dependent methyltransferase n=1 Tax=Rhizophagus irregularis TaxID=588596 RepID=A0A2I1ECI8_9GLOM|nr:S-adenosyl-L-methionine-dependent methyltransferase [Rhizophagus irregularis]PKY19833.1 S-adenosyl-L-methionine-dependent methyltransferase [Rhizophagus irregularis]
MSTNLKILPDDVTEYRTKEYWEKRYSKEPPEISFDWFKSYKELKPLFDVHLPNKNVSILVLGCGNSALSEDMYDDGYHNITNIDFSETVIENMRLRCKDRTGMTWIEMDIRDLNFLDRTFDIVIDKGTMDALMCDEGDVWDPNPEVIEVVRKEVDEVTRILKVGGKFIYVTFGQPHFRRRYLERPCWKVEVETLDNQFLFRLCQCDNKNKNLFFLD